MRVSELEKGKIYLLKKYCRNNKNNESGKYVELLDYPYFKTYPNHKEKIFPIDCIDREATENEIVILLGLLL